MQQKNHFANVCKTKTKLSVKSLDVVCNDTEHSEIGKLFSLTHEIGTVSFKGKRWFVTLEIKMPNCESQLVNVSWTLVQHATLFLIQVFAKFVLSVNWKAALLLN